MALYKWIQWLYFHGLGGSATMEYSAKELLENPDCFVLGVRTYERKKGKKVRFWLNSCQKLFFRITNHGKECPDPRSGLRGFPASPLWHLRAALRAPLQTRSSRPGAAAPGQAAAGGTAVFAHLRRGSIA